MLQDTAGRAAPLGQKLVVGEEGGHAAGDFFRMTAKAASKLCRLRDRAGHRPGERGGPPGVRPRPVCYELRPLGGTQPWRRRLRKEEKYLHHLNMQSGRGGGGQHQQRSLRDHPGRRLHPRPTQRSAALWSDYQWEKLRHYSNLGSFLFSLHHFPVPYGVYHDSPLPEAAREKPKNLHAQRSGESSPGSGGLRLHQQRGGGVSLLCATPRAR